jgi:hypothetical protein
MGSRVDIAIQSIPIISATTSDYSTNMAPFSSLPTWARPCYRRTILLWDRLLFRKPSSFPRRSTMIIR